MLMPPQAQAEKSFSGAGSEWRFYGGDQGASRYSPLDQINLFNVHRLKPAWIHHTGDKLDRPKTMIQCTPIVIGDAMYLTTARLQVRALNAATGEVLWNFDPYAGQRSSRARGVNRGVTYFEDGRDKRIFAAIQEKLFCLDARTGELIKSFGENGVVDLKQDFDRDMEGLFYKCTSPPVIYEDLILVSGGGGEGPRREGPGHIRGYDVYTGKRRWIFHTIPFPGEFGYETWSPDSWDVNGGTNNWAGMSLDTERGWLFASIGSPSFDFWGGDRIGDNLFGNCVLALDAKTCKRVWHYQIVRHDVWDYDLAAQPALVRLRKGDRLVDAVVQTTKMGLLFVLDRETGEPLFPIEERPVPESDLPDEKLAASQPVPLKPASLCRREFTEDGHLTGSAPVRPEKIPGGSNGRAVHAAYQAGDGDLSRVQRRRPLGRHQLRPRPELDVRQLERDDEPLHGRRRKTGRQVPVHSCRVHPASRPRGLPGHQTALGQDELHRSGFR